MEAVIKKVYSKQFLRGGQATPLKFNNDSLFINLGLILLMPMCIVTPG